VRQFSSLLYLITPIIVKIVNQRGRKGQIMNPVVQVPVVLISDFLATDIMLPLVNLDGDGF
jgi:hypothetical protein